MTLAFRQTLYLVAWQNWVALKGKLVTQVIDDPQYIHVVSQIVIDVPRTARYFQRR